MELGLLVVIGIVVFIWWSMRSAAKRKALVNAAIPSAAVDELQDGHDFDANFLEMTLRRRYSNVTPVLKPRPSTASTD